MAKKLSLQSALYRASFCVDYGMTSELKLEKEAEVFPLNEWGLPVAEKHKAKWLVLRGAKLITLYCLNKRSTAKKLIIHPVIYLPPAYEKAIRESLPVAA